MAETSDQRLIERLLARVEYDTNGGCWLWARGQTGNGYGKLQHEGSEQLVHRLAYIAWVGPIPPDRPHICHRCDVRRCIRPDHLFAGTHAENLTDMVRKNRHWHALLKADEIPAIRARLAAGERPASVARGYGVNTDLISNIAHGRAWKKIL